MFSQIKSLKITWYINNGLLRRIFVSVLRNSMEILKPVFYSYQSLWKNTDIKS